MPFTCAQDSYLVNKKCGEIIITTKKNAKNVYSFNCGFCDTIYIEMTNFSLHLEQEHVSQLEQTPPLNIDDHAESDDKPEINNQTAMGSLYVPDIKIEACMAEDIKLEHEQENLVTWNIKKEDVTPKFQDSIQPIENVDGFSLTNPDDNVQDKFIDLKEYKMENEPETYDMDMQTFSDGDNYNMDNQSELSADENSANSDFKADETSEEQEKSIILALIEAYEMRPQLWNSTQSEQCSLKQKDDIFKSITDDLNAKFNLKLEIYMVKKKFNIIRKQYEKEIAQQMNANEMVDSKLWYYENMNFLKSSVEQKMKPLTDKNLCDLIDIYKNYNSLWDVNHLAFAIKDKRHETLKFMLNEIRTKLNLFLNNFTLKKHLKNIHKSFSKDKQLRFECENKQMDFQPSCSYYDKCDFLDQHQGPFRCPSCRELIESYNDFQLHKSQHDGSLPFQCQDCGKGFQKITKYNLHARLHFGVSKFICKICDTRYPSNAELVLHMRSHTSTQPYSCSVCGEGFRTAICYDNHILWHEKKFKYFCHICKKGFNYMSQLDDHVKVHLKVRDVKCTVCGKAFIKLKQLRRHKRIHQDKTYSCDICSKNFDKCTSLKSHKKSHDKPIGASSIQKE